MWNELEIGKTKGRIRGAEWLEGIKWLPIGMRDWVGANPFVHRWAMWWRSRVGEGKG